MSTRETSAWTSTMCACFCPECQTDLRVAAALNAAEPVVRARAESMVERMTRQIDEHSLATAIVIPFPFPAERKR